MSISTILAAFDQSHTVSTDSRNIPPGSVFFALKGERFNGNKFAAQAIEAGASLAVVDEAEYVPEGDDRFVLVDDVLETLQRTGEAYRERFEFPVIGITGTNGKTTTKELLHAVLETEMRVQATKGNLNNHIGVPLTLLSMPTDLEVAIVEMGANKRGDIAELSGICHPTHALITNIGRAHLERFGDIEGVRLTKGELFDSIRQSGGLVYVNENDRRVEDRAKGIERRIGYNGADSSHRILDIRSLPDRMELDIELGAHGKVEFVTALVGRHNAENVLAAVTIGADFGISVTSLQAGIRNYKPRMNRTQLIQHGSQTILLDAYNANPSSMEATIRSVAEQNYGRVALVLGDMFELGENSQRFHQDLVALVGEVLPEALLVGVGEDMVEAMAAVSVKQGASYATTASADSALPELVREVDFILFKGSRGMALEKLLPGLGVKL